eukprot:Clim_evm27s202 gene=Clim_evmTU27s202
MGCCCSKKTPDMGPQERFRVNFEVLVNSEDIYKPGHSDVVPRTRMQIIDEALVAEPNEAHHHLAKALEEMKLQRRRDHATDVRIEAAFKKAMELDSENPHTVSAYAVWLTNHKREQEAYSLFKRFEKQYATREIHDMAIVTLMVNFGVFMAKIRNDVEYADNVLRRMAQTNPNDAFACGTYGIFLWRRRNSDKDAKAERYLRQAANARQDGQYWQQILREYEMAVQARAK